MSIGGRVLQRAQRGYQTNVLRLAALLMKQKIEELGALLVA
jgi:hypothetical protein